MFTCNKNENSSEKTQAKCEDHEYDESLYNVSCIIANSMLMGNASETPQAKYEDHEYDERNMLRKLRVISLECGHLLIHEIEEMIKAR